MLNLKENKHSMNCMSNKSNLEYFGFIGKILKIDLTEKKVSVEKINQNYSHNFLGGAGYACRYLFELIDKEIDPLSPRNKIMIMNGPLSGTAAPSSGRFVICSKSPYTNLWSESNCGGFFGPELKKAGYDGIIISGKSERPVYIKIFKDNVEICDASHIWSKGIIESNKILKKVFNDSNARVLCIGQAGKNLVKYAIVAAEGRAAGRTGLGAVFGSKKLKGIAVMGNNLKPKIARPSEFKEVVKKIVKYIANSNFTKAFRDYGTSIGIMSAHSSGDLPIKYFSQGEWSEIDKISGQTLRHEYLVKNRSCWNCVVGCGRIVAINNKEHSLPEHEGPEYETIAGFGSMILNSNLSSIIRANYMCNDYGIDTISSSGSIALLYYLYNQKKIKKEDTDNLDLQWGNSDSLLRLIEKIAFREGIGDLLADGSNAVGERFNISRDEIATVNNLEVPYHDMRNCYGMSLTYGFSPRGACHMTGDIYKIGRKGNEIDFSSVGVNKIDMHQNNKKMAEACAKLQDYRAFYSSLITCNFINPPPSYFVELLNSLFGIDLDLENIQLLGERIFTIKRLFNIKMGLNSRNDYIPKILRTPVKEGASMGKAPDFDKLKNYYYEVRNWDPQTGIPNKEKIRKLGLRYLLAGFNSL